MGKLKMMMLQAELLAVHLENSAYFISYLQGRLDWTHDQCMAPRENIDLTWREGRAG